MQLWKRHYSPDLTGPPLPRLTVSPAFIRESDSVQLSCETSPSVSVSQCYLFTEKRDFKPSCRQTLTGTELLSWSDQRSPAVVNVRCFYYAIGSFSPSSDSDPGSVTVQGKQVIYIIVNMTLLLNLNMFWDTFGNNALTCNNIILISTTYCFTKGFTVFLKSRINLKWWVMFLKCSGLLHMRILWT